eukprot:642640-Pleurochrysis_carterae.AAC.1
MGWCIDSPNMDREHLYHDNAASLWFMPVIVYWKPEDTEVRLRWQIAYGNIMLTHCEQMCQYCEVCRNQDTSSSSGAVSTQVMKDPPFSFHTVCRNRDTPSSGGAVSTQVMKDPPFPFHTVSIDHKTVTAPKAVSCVTTSAEETLLILMTHVITKYSFLMVIKSNNGSAFRNELTRAFAEYAGLRRAFVFPYNAPANGMTEQAVARIARLLVRHTQQFQNWPDRLPMVVFALNCTDHLSTGVSPFFALYGRHPISLPELENP